MNAELKISGRLAEVGNLDGGSTPGASIYAGDGRYIEVHNLSEDEARAIAPAFGEMVTVSIALAERTTAPATTPDTSQDLAKLDGAVAWHLIERHADSWSEVGNMMESWLAARMAAAPAPIQQRPEAPARQALHTMQYEDGRIGWYFDCDGHYIDVEKDDAGKYSVYFRDRATGKEGWLDQADSATPPALAGSQVQAAGDARKLNWGEVSRPSEEIGYDHVIAQTPFGRVLITWKGWKDYPSFDIEDHPLQSVRNWCGSSLESAKEEAERAYFEAIDAAMREQQP